MEEEEDDDDDEEDPEMVVMICMTFTSDASPMHRAHMPTHYIHTYPRLVPSSMSGPWGACLSRARVQNDACMNLWGGDMARDCVWQHR